MTGRFGNRCNCYNGHASSVGRCRSGINHNEAYCETCVDQCGKKNDPVVYIAVLKDNSMILCGIHVPDPDHYQIGTKFYMIDADTTLEDIRVAYSLNWDFESQPGLYKKIYEDTSLIRKDDIKRRQEVHAKIFPESMWDKKLMEGYKSQ